MELCYSGAVLAGEVLDGTFSQGLVVGRPVAALLVLVGPVVAGMLVGPSVARWWPGEQRGFVSGDDDGSGM